MYQFLIIAYLFTLFFSAKKIISCKGCSAAKRKERAFFLGLICTLDINILSTCIPSFHLVGILIHEERDTKLSSVYLYFIRERDEKKEKQKKKAKINLSICFSFPQNNWLLLKCKQNLKTLALIEAEKSVTEN